MATTSTTLRIPAQTLGRRSWVMGGVIAAVLVATLVTGLELQGRGAKVAPAGPALEAPYQGPITGTGPDLTVVADQPAPAPLAAVTGTGPDLMIVARDWSMSKPASERGAIQARHHLMSSGPAQAGGPSGTDPRCGTSVARGPC